MAFVCAPMLAAAALAFLFPAYDGLPDLADRVWRSFLIYWIFGALPPTVIVGIPLYLFLRSRVRPTLWACGASGAATISIPWAILTLRAMSAMEEESDGRRYYILHGNVTLLGWQRLAESLIEISLLGFVTGVIFWLIAAAKMPRQTPPT